MIPDAAATTSTPAPANPASTVGAAPSSASSSAPAPSAAALTPVQLLWEVATLAFELMRRLVNVLQPIQQYYPKQALLLARVLIDIPRIFLTLRYAPERVTIAQLRHLTRARHILQALFGYTLPSSLGTPISRLASAAPASQHPSASTESLGARTPSSATTPSPATPASPSPNAPSSIASATPSIRQVPEIPMVAGISHVPASPTVDHNLLTPSPASHDSHPSHTSPAPCTPQSNGDDPVGLRDPNPQSSFSPYIPDFHTLAQALKADSLPPNCAGALFENPGEALVKALHQLHAIYFSLYPNQSPSPSPSNPQSNIPQSDDPSVNPVNPVNTVNTVNPVHSVHSPSPAQSEILLPHSAAPP